MTSGERKCWNVTILDDSIDEGVESFQVSLHAASFRSAYAPVFIADNDGGIHKICMCKSFIKVCSSIRKQSETGGGKEII